MTPPILQKEASYLVGSAEHGINSDNLAIIFNEGFVPALAVILHVQLQQLTEAYRFDQFRQLTSKRTEVWPGTLPPGALEALAQRST